MSLGGGAPKVRQQSPMPTMVEPEIALARADQKERMRRAQGRAASQVTSPALRSQQPDILKLRLG